MYRYAGMSACIYVCVHCMYVCMYVCMCMYACMYVCMHACMYIFVFECVCACLCMYDECECMHACVYACVCACVYACVCACVYACVCESPVCCCICVEGTPPTPVAAAEHKSGPATEAQEISIQVLATLEFTSNRRRQSVVIKDGSRYLLLMKGADVAVFARLAPDQAEARAVQEAFLDNWSQQVCGCMLHV